MKCQRSVIIILLTLFLFSPLYAEEGQTSKKGGVKKQNISFEDELVEGASQKPDLFYMLQKKNLNYKKLIRLREDFLPEMRRTAEDIRRSGGVD